MKILFLIVFISGATSALMAQQNPRITKKTIDRYHAITVELKTRMATYDSILQTRKGKTNLGMRTIDSVLVMIMEDRELLLKKMQKNLSIIDSLTKEYKAQSNAYKANPNF